MSDWARELAWAAGLFEGEGCFSLKAAGRTNLFPSPACIMASTDEDTVRRFQRAVGVGSVTGPHRTGGANAAPHFKPAWYWRTSGFPKTQAVVAMLWFGLGERRRATARRVLTEGRGVGQVASQRVRRTRERAAT